MAPRVSANGKLLGRPPKEQAVPAPSLISKIAQAIKARYDAAGGGRRMAGWNPPSTGPNTALNNPQKLLDRAQDSIRNDWASESGAQKWATALIGIGITPRFKRITNVERRKVINDLFIEHSKVIDADCVLDYFGQQSLGVRSWFTDGEYFLRYRARFADEGLPVPHQVQMLESAMCPRLDADSFEGLPKTNVIRQGIEINKRGKIIAYWFHKSHPNESDAVLWRDAKEYIRVAASEVTHVFEPIRIGQRRGISQLAPILARLRETGDYEDAVLTRQKIANLFVAFITRKLPSLDPSDPAYGALTGAVAEFAASVPADDVPGAQLLPMAPGLMQELEDGQDVQFANPPEAGTNYSDYLRTQTMGTSAALGLPYEVHSGDIREISDRTLRVIINEFRRLAQRRQWQMVIPMHCRRVIEWFAKSALLIGAITADEYDDVRNAEHSPHGWEYIHPVQDPQGKQIEVDAGFRSRSSVIAERGDDPDQVDEERLADQERAEALGINPPAVPGAAQPGQEADPEDPEDDPESEDDKTARAEAQEAFLLRTRAEAALAQARADHLRTPPPPPAAPAPEHPFLNEMRAFMAAMAAPREPVPPPQISVEPHLWMAPSPAASPAPAPAVPSARRKVPERDERGLVARIRVYEGERHVSTITPVRDATGFVTEFKEELV